MVIHSKKYQNVPFFRDKDTSFIVWVASIIKSLAVEAEEYSYKEGEDLVVSKFILCWYFSVFLGRRIMWLRLA